MKGKKSPADDKSTADPQGRYRAPALEKGLDILQLLNRESKPLTLTAICERLDRSQGEMFRMVQVLQTRGFIDQDPKSDGYHLTDLLFSMAMRQPVTQSLVEVALPLMRTLASDISQSCHLALHSRGEIVVIARMESADQVGFSVRVGYRRSITKSVSGLMLFAFQPEDVRTRWLEMLDPKPSAAELKTFFAAATSARKNGFARAPSSAVKGVTDLSAPIIRGDRAAAALTVPYIKTTNSQGSVHTVIEKIQAVANAITAQLSEGDSRA